VRTWNARPPATARSSGSRCPPASAYSACPAIEFGRVRTELRRAGRPIPMFDILIAAIAGSNGLVLVTADGHFALVPGLATENWLPKP
jgi:predicted nucleic acid-binding protein